MNENRATFRESREKLTRLTDVPVDTQHVKHLTDLLVAHGAKVTPVLVKPEGATRTYYLCTIDLPDGTYREYGMMLFRSSPFIIYFPDSYELHGAELYGTTAALDEMPKILLYIPKQT